MSTQQGDAPRSDGLSPLPLYHKIYMVLRERLEEGAFPADAPMPSEHVLAAEFGVSRITIRRALERLTGKGMIARHRGRGTFPIAPRVSRPLRTDISGLMESLQVMGRNTSVQLLEFGYVHASAEIAAALEITPGAEVQKAVRVRRHDGRPVSYLTTHVLAEVGRRFGPSDLETTPLLSLLAKSGVEVTAADQSITACMADTAAATQLEVEIGAPLLVVVRVIRDQSDRPVEHIRALYRPDLYEFQMSMSRKAGSGKMRLETGQA